MSYEFDLDDREEDFILTPDDYDDEVMKDSDKKKFRTFW